MTSDTVFTIHRPSSSASPLVLDSPHSGHQFPADFGSVLSVARLRSAEDVLVDQLYASAGRHGAPLLAANFPRSYIDPNRAAGDIDLDLLDAPWPHHFEPSGKARLGKALIWRTLDDGTPIYDARLSVATVQHRITHYLQPYQAALKTLLDAAHAEHGVVYHINCHSMDPVGSAMGEGGQGVARADVVLGDRDGSTCEPAFVALVEAHLRAKGYTVARNDPYKGVALIARIGQPALNRHSLQIEIRRPIYMDEQTRERSADFGTVQRDITELLQAMAGYLRAHPSRTVG